MRSFAAISFSLFTLGALARPSPNQGRSNTCLNDGSAWKVANNFKTLISAYTDTAAEAYLCTDVHDYSDSVITLIDSGCPATAPAGSPLPFVPLGSATFDSISSFEEGQGGQPNVTFDILNVWHGCNEVTVRWRSPKPNPYPGAPGSLPNAPAAEEQVTGIVVLEVAFNGWQSAQPYLIDTIFSEFNSGAWLYDLGVYVPANCSAAAKRSLDARMPAYFLNSRKH